MRTDMVIDALHMAAWNRDVLDLEGLRAHSDAGSQFTSILWGEQLAQLGAVPSIGTVGDSYDNALAETVNGYYKAELIYGPEQGPLAQRRRGRTRHPRVGPLAQQPAPPQPLRRRAAGRVRGHLHCRTSRPTSGWEPINRASGKPRAIHIMGRQGISPDAAYANLRQSAKRTGVDVRETAAAVLASVFRDNLIGQVRT